MLLMSKERIFSIGISVISILLTIQAFRYPAESSQFPRFLCLLMVLFSVMILVRNIMGKTTAKAECHASFKEVMKVPFIVFASTAMYIFAIQYVGYFVSTVIYMFLMMSMFGQKRILPMGIAVTVFLGVIYALFVSFLGLRLPEGFLF